MKFSTSYTTSIFIIYIYSFQQNAKLKVITIFTMSHLRIPKKQSHSPRNKIHSQQSKTIKYSAQRIVHQGILKRRFTTQNTSLQKFDADKNLKQHLRPKQKQSHSTMPVDSSMRYQIQQAKKAFKTKNTKKALPLFKKIYEKYPAYPDIPYFIGSCLLNEGKLGAALTYFTITLQLDKNFDRNIYIYMAICHKGMGKISQAIEVLGQAVDKYPRFQQALFYKAKMHIKLNQPYQTVQTLKKCILINNKNQLAYIILGDNLKKIGRTKQCFSKYDKAILIQGEHTKIAHIHKLNTLVETGNMEVLASSVDQFKQQYKEQPEFCYFQAIVFYSSGQLSEAVTLFQICLKQNLGSQYLSSIMKYLMKICIQTKDFFGAEHLVTRARILELSDQQILLYYILVQGINDLIKRKISQCEQKLNKVYRKSQKITNYIFLYEAVLPYYGYCLFQKDQIIHSLQIFNQFISLPIKQEKKQTQYYNLSICQGILYHKNQNYLKAENRFADASKIFDDKIEPIFFMCVNEIQKLKNQGQGEQRQLQHLNKINQLIQGSLKNNSNSLFLFYISLVKLYENKDACQTIKQAIKFADQEVSQYFFIEALAYYQGGYTQRGLTSISKAIQIDQNIPQFFKQRSKYFYLLGRYQQCVEDILKVLQENNDDEQAKLLLTFYYYLTEDYQNSLQLLKELVISQNKSFQSSQNRFSQFEQALNFRLQLFDGCGIIGRIIESIVQGKKLSQEQVIQIGQLINKKTCYSQFNIYFFYLMWAAYYLYVEVQQQKLEQKLAQSKFDGAIDCLFGALQQINFQTENQSQGNQISKDQFSPLVQNMLSQVKYNIIIANLLRSSYMRYGRDGQDLLKQTIKFINIFISETQDLDFIQVMKKLLNFLTDQTFKNSQIVIQLGKKKKKASDIFPEMKINIMNIGVIKTKFLLFYPQKLKFNIAPEFDESFLYNFDIQKIDAKLCPPWYKLEGLNGGLVFTDKIRNQSVLMSETQKSNTPLLRMASPIQISLRERFKLDDSIQRKLNRLMKKR